MLCADLVRAEWCDPPGQARSEIVTLEDISSSGACVQSESPVPVGAAIRIRHGRRRVSGVVRYCVFREIGYFVGLEFEPGFEWSPAWFRPRHLLDPREVRGGISGSSAGTLT